MQACSAAQSCSVTESQRHWRWHWQAATPATLCRGRAWGQCHSGTESPAGPGRGAVTVIPYRVTARLSAPPLALAVPVAAVAVALGLVWHTGNDCSACTTVASLRVGRATHCRDGRCRCGGHTGGGPPACCCRRRRGSATRSHSRFAASGGGRRRAKRRKVAAPECRRQRHESRRPSADGAERQRVLQAAPRRPPPPGASGSSQRRAVAPAPPLPVVQGSGRQRRGLARESGPRPPVRAPTPRPPSRAQMPQGSTSSRPQQHRTPRKAPGRRAERGPGGSRGEGSCGGRQVEGAAGAQRGEAPQAGHAVPPALGASSAAHVIAHELAQQLRLRRPASARCRCRSAGSLRLS